MAALASLMLGGFAPSYTESAVANGDTRTLHLYHTHTFETIDATFRVDGHYDPAVLAQLNHFLRDWRNNDEHQMDPRLFDAVWEAYRTAGATDRIQIYSAYRSPETNAMLRRRSRAVAEHSQHMLGKAMDTTMPGFPMSRVREAGMKLQHGGVGWYPSANFVHLDVGGVRSWPRMSYDQLANLFPDGKTVHIAADGRTMPGYDQARMELAERGGVEVPPAQESGGFFAWLFGGGNGGGSAREDEEDRRAPRAAPQPAPVAVASVAPPQPAPEQPTALAYAPAASAPIAPVAAAAPEAQRQQVASLEPADVAQPDNFVAVMPPRRPDDLAAVETPDVPLPPIRPDVLDRLQTASIRYSDAQSAPVASTPAGVLPLRRSSLPGIIMQGADETPLPVPAPRQALAFAAEESAPIPVARPRELAMPLALRSATHRTIVAAVRPVETDADLAETPAPTGLAGPRLTGLRRAAQEMGGDKAAAL